MLSAGRDGDGHDAIRRDGFSSWRRHTMGAGGGSFPCSRNASADAHLSGCARRRAVRPVTRQAHRATGVTAKTTSPSIYTRWYGRPTGRTGHRHPLRSRWFGPSRFRRALCRPPAAPELHHIGIGTFDHDPSVRGITSAGHGDPVERNGSTPTAPIHHVEPNTRSQTRRTDAVTRAAAVNWARLATLGLTFTAGHWSTATS